MSNSDRDKRAKPDQHSAEAALQHHDKDSAPPAARPNLPGEPDWTSETARYIRVDQAGEWGAVHIYRGQLAVLGARHPKADLIRHMAEQEKAHLAHFDHLITTRGIRPSLLSPLWESAGFALGAVSALISPEAAMACTEAVEEVIDAHYESQRTRLQARGDERELEKDIARFQAEELEHKTTAQQEGASSMPFHRLFTNLIKTGCRTAIWTAKRL